MQPSTLSSRRGSPSSPSRHLARAACRGSSKKGCRASAVIPSDATIVPRMVRSSTTDSQGSRPGLCPLKSASTAKVVVPNGSLSHPLSHLQPFNLHTDASGTVSKGLSHLSVKVIHSPHLSCTVTDTDCPHTNFHFRSNAPSTIKSATSTTQRKSKHTHNHQMFFCKHFWNNVLQE